MKKKYFFIICGFILAIILTAVITTIIVKNNNKNKINEGKNIESNNNINIKETDKPDFNEEKALNEDVSVNEKEETEQEKDIPKEEHKNKEEKDEESKPDNTLNETDVPIQKTEEDIIKYVEEISLEETGDKIKKGFVTVVDFIFYDGKIYGKTFFELSSTAKIKIISLALKIDSKIEEYYPDYKEKISDSTDKVYTNIKTKLVTLYLDTTVKICNDNPTVCEDAKQGLTELKQSFGLTWNFIKDISGIGIAKLKDWYEVWKEA